MDALEAANRIEVLRERVSAISDVVYYVEDEREYKDEISVLCVIKSEIQTELEELEDKLRAVQL
ncbi:hypothetical protein [Peribacillus butanolivorans]|uniref:Uncharacterized protein n=1 Tax=Peribacillus butanolivorans TaxID=421767 RepID=A0ABM6XMX0_9BACI|nr:hypothetical protein [Peribacillus butanolivorans]AXN39823.1 hypothetical protein DTO10_16610 [Peribacillus butanolivorans]